MRGYIDSVAKALQTPPSRRGVASRPQRLRGRRSTFVPIRDESLRALS
ncbi:hypothetical protein SAMN05880545_2542 [Microbacterium sp. RU33B]|nr:hypothetical protein SAMN05880545_2542 [Microbacterium sp. RU33B]